MPCRKSKPFQHRKEKPAKRKRGFALPSAYTILFILIILVAIATWIIPSGSYEYNEDGEPLPGTYQEVDHDPQKIFLDSLKAPINGLYGIEDETGNISFWNNGELFGAIDVALFIIVIGGFLGVTMKTGAINAGIARVVAAMKGREKWMIPMLMGVFALGGTSYGMAEETLAFYPLIVPVMIAAGYDSLTGAAVIMLGAGIGVLGSTVNPFATGIASGFADVSISDGIVASAYRAHRRSRLRHLLHDALRRESQGRSLEVARLRTEGGERKVLPGGPGRHQRNSAHSPGAGRSLLVLFFLAFLVMVYGVIPWEDMGVGIPTLWWWFPEMTASFLLFAIIIGVVGGLSEKELTGSFIDGSRDLLGVALIIGIARGITVIMNNGMITDTVLNWCEERGGRPGRHWLRRSSCSCSSSRCRS